MNRIDATLERLHRLYPKLIDLKLDRIEVLLAKLGSPHLKLAPVIHVAGTNGKGSVCAFLRAIAEAAGLRVQVYTSPHLLRFNERIRLVDGLANDAQLTQALDEIEAVNDGGPITVFEAITAAAFVLFARETADLCIVEVGLGGRFDATNVVCPAACAITSLSLDHREFLGSTLEVIAAEKAGIIKPRIPVVCGLQNHTAMARIRHEAQLMDAPLLRRGRAWNCELSDAGLTYNGQIFPHPALIGAHQAENAAIAIAALGAAGFNLTPDAIAKGLVSAEWPARLQRLSGELLKHLPVGSELWLDGAHNPGGAAALAAQLARWKTPTKLIIGMKQAKDVREFLGIIMPHAATIFAVAEPEQHLALPVAAIIEASNGAALPGPDIRGALTQITQPSRVVICGSLYLAGEVLKLDTVGAISELATT